MAHRTPSWAPIMNSLARCQIQCITAARSAPGVRSLITERDDAGDSPLVVHHLLPVPRVRAGFGSCLLLASDVA